MVDKVSTKFTYNFDVNDELKQNYGILPYIVSDTDPEKRYEKKYESIENIGDNISFQYINLRARLATSRVKGKRGFLVLRQSTYTVQATVFLSDGLVSQQMLDFVSSIPTESLIDVYGQVVPVNTPIESCTTKNFEISSANIFLVSPSINILPFQIADANRKVPEEFENDDEVKVEEKQEVKTEVKEEEVKDDKDKKKKDKKAEKAEKKEKKDNTKEEKGIIVVKNKTRFDNRTIDLRTNVTNALMRIQAGVGRLYRNYLDKLGFVEIHSPKIIKGASEGGTNVFKFKYFEKDDVCLAQSPQLYKQMAVIGGLEKVYEIAPVFRAENSNTGRHLTEFTMLDMEMEFKEHFFEVLDVINGVFVHIFDGLKSEYKHELNVIANQYPFELIEYKNELLKLTFHEGVELLKENGIEQDVNKDLDTINERILGELVKKKYGTDFYVLYRYPISARPFYTMRDPKDNNFTNSYDAFIRGEEVLSGAQRIHDYDQLLKNVIDAKIDPKTLEDYLNAFKYGAPPHGGMGVGLERVVKLFVGLKNVKKCCLFVRDPTRLTP